MLRDTLLQLPTQHKRLLQIAADVLLIWLALCLAISMREGITELPRRFLAHYWLWWVAPLVALPVFIKLGLYRAVLRYVGSEALLTILKAITLSALVLALVIYIRPPLPVPVPRSLVFGYWFCSLLLIGSSRLVLRQYLLADWSATRQLLPFLNQRDPLPAVLIYGAGTAGNQLLVALRQGRSLRPVAFVDDDPALTGRTIGGLAVYEPGQLAEAIEKTAAAEILLALPSASRARRKQILENLAVYPLRVRSMPGINELASGKVQIADVQEVDIADLLGRDTVAPDPELLNLAAHGKVVMVTGAGGSIGSELCRQVLACQPRKLILFDHSEYNLYAIEQELLQRKGEDKHSELCAVIGSVRNYTHLAQIMVEHQVQTLYHAAAYKHVPLVESNIREGIENNIGGTLNVALAAIHAQVERVVLISTDKAVRPTNVMGATKRIAEMLLQAISQHKIVEHPLLPAPTANNSCFCMVRFGNVLGSSGSVIPLFREQIRKGGPITVTHPEVTRYFMTIPEAAQLVLQAGAMAQGGEVFVLEMGEPVKILELARKLVQLSGLTPYDDKQADGDIQICFSGLRPGEKLHEELLISNNAKPTAHPMIHQAQDPVIPLAKLLDIVNNLFEPLPEKQLKQLFAQAMEYKPCT